MRRPRIAVLGAGSWGTALAVLLARNGVEVRLWGHLVADIERLRADRENRQFLPGVLFPAGLEPLSDLQAAVEDVDEVLLVVPSHAFRVVAEALAPLLVRGAAVSWATKGFEPDTGLLLHEVAAEVLPGRPLAVLSGPSFAGEVAQGLPTAITVASADAAHAARVAGFLHGETFRAYTSEDVVGVQVGGAAKNVMAIAAGIADGLGFGANSRAALITRGLAEITRLGVAMGADPLTFAGLAGLGDLVLTTTGQLSRNRALGEALAKGESLASYTERHRTVAEGVGTARSAVALGQRAGVELPICEQVYQILFTGKAPARAIEDLMERTLKMEQWR